ncbi:MAG: cobalamin biosynthesis protein CbiD [bacterium]|nr:cobalamin biosynthesis protein CbiD [bacterium]
MYLSNKHIIKNGKQLRYGYTTGSCAAAAAKAAATMFFNGSRIVSVVIDTPKGWPLELPVDDIEITKEYAECSVTKDAGDDPDITNGIKIFARAKPTEGGTILITAGEGIGVVTKKGLQVSPGNPAINPVPMEMIRREVERVKPENPGVEIELSVPGGEEIAKKTFNPKLGIEGGISILGTTGIVEPMSSEALKESLSIELSILKEQGKKTLVFVPGNYGETFALNELDVDPGSIVRVSNYIGYMLEQAVYYNVEKIVLIGHIGKLVKVAGGIFNTHSKVSDARMEILAAQYGVFSGSIDAVKNIMNCGTSEEALDYIDSYIEENNFFEYLSEIIRKKCMEYVHNSIEVEVVVFSQISGLLGKSGNADTFLELVK